MTVVLDPCALVDANIDELNNRISPAAKVIDAEKCYMTPINVAEAYMCLKDDLSNELADTVLGMILQNVTIIVADDRDPELIRYAVEARSRFGVAFSVAFCAALAKKLDCAVLTNEDDFQPIENDGFCQIRHY